MKQVSAAFQAMLESRRALVGADLYTLTLVDGTVLHWTSAQRALTVGGIQYAVGPAITRDRLSTKIGLGVDEINISLDDTGATLINGLTLAQAAQRGRFDGAQLEIRRWLSPVWAQEYGPELVANGQGRLGDNTNFSQFTRVPDPDAPGGAAFEATATSGTAYGPDALIPIDIARSYLESLSVACPNPRTNLLLQTADFSNSVWGQYYDGATITGGVTAPDGTTTAQKITPVTTGSYPAISGVLQSVSLADVPVGVFTVSVWLKADDSTTTINFGASDGLGSENITLTTNWQRYSWTIDNSDGHITESRLFQMRSTVSGQHWYAWHPQTELGPETTTYIESGATQGQIIPDFSLQTACYDAAENYLSTLTLATGTLSDVYQDLSETIAATDWPAGAAFVLPQLTSTTSDGSPATVRVGGVSLKAIGATPQFDDSLLSFIGTIGDVQVSAGQVQLTVESPLAQLKATFPRSYFLPSCENSLYDTICGLDRNNFKESLAVGADAGPATIPTNSAKADGWYALGKITFTSGANAGLTRTIKSYAGGVITLVYPLEAIPAAGDTLDAWAGCDKTRNQCGAAKFNNLAHFRGTPYVPDPATLYAGSGTQAPAPPSGAPYSPGRGSGRGVAGAFKRQ